MNEALQCPGCGVGFVRTKRNQRFHDRECQVRHNNEQAAAKREAYNANRRVKAAKTRPMAEYTCEGCGKTETTPVRRLPRRFCSKTCKNVVHGRQWQAANKEHVRAYRRTPERMEASRERSSAYYAANRETVRETMRGRFQATRLTAPWRTLLMSAKHNAEKRGLPFDLSEEWAVERWTGRCEFSGIEFQIGLPKSAHRMYGPSIDRMAPALGYVTGNCRFILYGLNAFKGTATDEDMLAIAEALLKYRSSIQGSKWRPGNT